jgi:hypothetical protein
VISSVDGAHDRGVVEVVVEVLGDGLEQGEVVVEELLHRGLAVAEIPDRDGHQDDEHTADQPLHGEDPEDEQVAQRLAADDQRGVLGLAAAVRLAQGEVAAAQAAPGVTEGGVGVQVLVQMRLGGRIGDVPAP